MDLVLKDRVALVTGGSRGIGRVITLNLANAGADVIICGRSEVDLRRIQSEVERLNSKAYIFPVDATKGSDVKSMFRRVRASVGRVDILVNNIGGVKRFASALELTDADWLEAFDVNLMTMVRFVREAIPLLQRSQHARMVNIASVVGIRPGTFSPHYGAVKAAVIHFSKYLANMLAPAGVRVNAVCPYTVKDVSNKSVWKAKVRDTARMRKLALAEAERRLEAEVVAKTPLGAISSPEDVAALVRFLASDEAKFITGECFRVDGGTVNSIF